jgi:hypothetical protein
MSNAHQAYPRMQSINSLINQIIQKGEECFKENIPEEIKNVLMKLSEEIIAENCEIETDRYDWKCNITERSAKGFSYKMTYSEWWKTEIASVSCYQNREETSYDGTHLSNYEIVIDGSCKYYATNPFMNINSWNDLKNIKHNYGFDEVIIPAALYFRFVNPSLWNEDDLVCDN